MTKNIFLYFFSVVLSQSELRSQQNNANMCGLYSFWSGTISCYFSTTKTAGKNICWDKIEGNHNHKGKKHIEERAFDKIYSKHELLIQCVRAVLYSIDYHCQDVDDLHNVDPHYYLKIESRNLKKLKLILRIFKLSSLHWMNKLNHDFNPFKNNFPVRQWILKENVFK